VRENIPKFDVLLNGATGSLITTKLKEGANASNQEEPLNVIVKTFSEINPPSIQRRNRLYSILINLFFHNKNLIESNNKSLQRKKIDGVISEKEFEESLRKIRQFINSNKNNGKTNFEICYKYHNFHLSSKAKYGVFESLNNHKTSYGIYYPFLMDEILNWKTEYFLNRNLLRWLIIKKHTKLSKIPDTGLKIEISSGYGKNFFEKTVNRVIFMINSLILLIRGNGVWNRKKWVNNRKCKIYIQKELLKSNELFEKMFDTKRIIHSFKDDRISPRLYTNILKVKQLLDSIVTKNYKNFID
jgi:hypothetical protein